MRVDDIKIGHVYGNGKGLYRKVRRFTNTLGKEIATPYNVYYVRCNEGGAVREKAKEQLCWCTTFADWAKEQIGDIGNLKGFDPTELPSEAAAE